MVKRLRVMEKKLTNSGPFRESVDKHSIYTLHIDIKIFYKHFPYSRHARLVSYILIY